MTRTLALAGLVALAGCDAFGSDDDGICPAVYVTYTVEVVGPDGAPASGLAAQSVVVSTGDALPDTGETSYEPGTYVVATDGGRGEIGVGPTRVRFTAENDSLRASADYVFGAVECGLGLLSGPSQITATRR